MPDTPYGKPISIEQAQAAMDNHNAIKKALSDHHEIKAMAVSDDVNLKSANHYVTKTQNAFVFDKAMVTRFFDNDRQGKSADYLVVIMGAHPSDDVASKIAQNDPTVILVGCTMNNGQLQALDMEDPASEHPPEEDLPVFPPTGTLPPDPGAI